MAIDMREVDVRNPTVVEKTAEEKAEEHRAARENVTLYAASQVMNALRGLSKEEAERVLRSAAVFHGVAFENPRPYTGIRGAETPK